VASERYTSDTREVQARRRQQRTGAHDCHCDTSLTSSPSLALAAAVCRSPPHAMATPLSWTAPLLSLLLAALISFAVAGTCPGTDGCCVRRRCEQAWCSRCRRRRQVCASHRATRVPARIRAASVPARPRSSAAKSRRPRAPARTSASRPACRAMAPTPQACVPVAPTFAAVSRRLAARARTSLARAAPLGATHLFASRCSSATLFSIGGTPVKRLKGDTAFFWTSGVQVDADGAPNAYNANNTGIDYLGNAGSPGNWWGIATDSKGTPYVQGEYPAGSYAPFKGYRPPTSAAPPSACSVQAQCRPDALPLQQLLRFDHVADELVVPIV